MEEAQEIMNKQKGGERKNDVGRSGDRNHLCWGVKLFCHLKRVFFFSVPKPTNMPPAFSGWSWKTPHQLHTQPVVLCPISSLSGHLI